MNARWLAIGAAMAACSAPPPAAPAPATLPCPIEALAFDVATGAVVAGTQAGNVVAGDGQTVLHRGTSPVVGIVALPNGDLVVGRRDGSFVRRVDGSWRSEREPAGELLAFAADAGRIVAIERNRERTQLTVLPATGSEPAGDDGFVSVAIGGDGIAVGCQSNAVRCYRWHREAPSGLRFEQTLEGAGANQWPARAVAMEGKRVLIGGGRLPCVRAPDTQERYILEDEPAGHVMTCMAVDAARSTVVTGHVDGAVHLWRRQRAGAHDAWKKDVPAPPRDRPTEKDAPVEGARPVRAIAIAADGSRVAWAHDTVIVVRDLCTP